MLVSEQARRQVQQRQAVVGSLVWAFRQLSQLSVPARPLD